MSTHIHPTAVIDPKAQIAEGVQIGPYCVVGERVVLGKDVRLISHVCVDGWTEVGEGTTIYPFASIGHRTQDLKFRGEDSKLVIGKNNTIREYATMQAGTEGGIMLTQVGDNCLFMVGTHVAHDCIVGNHVVMANYATLAGHVIVEDYVIIGGLSGVHQRARIGQHAIIGGLSPVDGDVIPFGSVKGERAFLNGLNIIGLKRRGFSREDIDDLRQAYRMLFADEKTMTERIEEVSQEFSDKPSVMTLVDFMRAESKSGFCLPNAHEN